MAITSVKLHSNNHSVFSMHYHLIFVVKYRRRVIDDVISDKLRRMFISIGEPYKLTVEEWNHDKDHIHVMFRAEPESELSKFINAYKSASSRIIKKEFPQVKKFLWKEMFRSGSFCLLTTGGASVDTIRRYIRDRGHNNR